MKISVFTPFHRSSAFKDVQLKLCSTNTCTINWNNWSKIHSWNKYQLWPVVQHSIEVDQLCRTTWEKVFLVKFVCNQQKCEFNHMTGTTNVSSNIWQKHYNHNPATIQSVLTTSYNEQGFENLDKFEFENLDNFESWESRQLWLYFKCITLHSSLDSNCI